MPIYKIEVWEEMGGYMTIKANSEEEAEELAQEHIDDHGLNSADGVEVEVTHRDTHTQGTQDVTQEIQDRLEYLRTQLNEECISYSELAELQSLAAHIEPGDTQLLEAAGVPENN